MARQTEIEKQLIMARKKIGYEELVQIEEKADVEMEDVQMEGAKVIGEEEAAAEVLTQLGKFSISAKAEVPRAPRRLAPLPRRARRKVASDAVHRFVQRNDYDKDLENRMADDRRGGGNFNRKRRFNRGITAPRIHGRRQSLS